jgi:Cell division protein CrgA
VPKSRVRKKKVYTPPTDVRPAAGAKKKKPSPRWVPVVAVALIVIGIAWLVTYYLTQGEYPIKDITYWNLAVGFGFMVGSLAVLTQWR